MLNTDDTHQERMQSARNMLHTALWLGWLLIGINIWMIVDF